ncbi:hypothetical protein GA0116948_101403 [Chitinophaga costaii]|uniref:Uncharacterized protein n=1 Tax=Chitinophaga costaii TaxID=1335309 RepID=A0A1C3ZHK1_9BACT|nr:hypothetical protein [Chitinophaga costaii]PUZ30377.1 hypothetical protein DCM91_02575 [Chitinophaga costaii]SCB81889.1 hypothetical protein GA0116948_101403 [Chitinophaga costaii]
MKKILWAVCTLLLCQLAVQAQTLKTFFADDKATLTYLGVDFTQTRYLGETALNATDFISKVVPSYNDVVVNEVKKYDIAGAFHHPVKNELTQVTKFNEGISEDKLKSSDAADFERFKDADIAKIAAHYKGSGIGLLFIVEALDKGQKKGAIYAVLIDLSHKKVLLSQRYVQTGKGFTMRNYWLHVVYETINDIDNHDYKKWVKANS